jgi:LuxR family maltose regulon positive regulatory protein
VTSSLLATKIHRPAIPPRRVRRPHLIERLNEGLGAGRQITLVSAPAGFGKTTCVGKWLTTLDRWPATWLSLDAGDDDPGRFFAYLIAALQKIDGKLGQEIERALRAGQLPPGEIVSTTLINDILELESAFLLVLDDLQAIQDPAILSVLETLVSNMPPPLHLVLISREDPPLPLARLRANNRLTEIRAEDLRFTRRDTLCFLHDVMGLSLSQADVAVLEDKTEGWIAGLQLAGLSIRDRPDPSGFIATLSGSHPFILRYLTEEVLSQQPEEVQHFLLQTAILDKLNGDLCNAVAGRSDSRALLEELFNANLFLIPLDEEGQWYRYHHLFADLLQGLQRALHEEETVGLHRRASRWYARAEMGSEAIEHALAAQDYGMAVALLERHAPGLIMQGYAKTVDGWMQAVPAEWASSSPRANLAFAWMHLLRGTYEQASPYLERLQATFAGPEVASRLGEEGDLSLRAEWLAMQSLLVAMEGKATESMALATRALEIAPEQDSRVRSLAYFGLACVCQLVEEYTRAVEAYQMAIQKGRVAGNFVAEMMSTAGLAQMALERGQLHLAFEIASPACARVERSSSPPPISAVVYGVLGQVHYQWHQIEQARGDILRALQLSTLGGYNTGMALYRALLSDLLQMEGDLEAAAREIQQAADLMRLGVSADVRHQVVVRQVGIDVARNRPAAAEMALQGYGFTFRPGFSFPDLPPDQKITHPIGSLHNSALGVLLFQARARRDPASLMPGIDLADHLIARALRGDYRLVALEALLLRAQMHAELGHRQASRADYARALELAEPEEYVGIFVAQGPAVAGALAGLVEQGRPGGVEPGYVEGILAAFPRSQRPGAVGGDSPVLIEPLTDRELDVLRLMAEGLTYREIAERLFISLNTVRSHAKAIYGKLDVNNRTRAIEMARHLEIL